MLENITHEIDGESSRLPKSAERRSAAGESALRHLYSDTVDPTSATFEMQPLPGRPETMVDLINADAARGDAAVTRKMLVFGEDVADCSRAKSILREVKGKGGVFKATHGLQTEFGVGACSTRRSPRRRSWGAPSGWRRAA